MASYLQTRMAALVLVACLGLRAFKVHNDPTKWISTVSKANRVHIQFQSQEESVVGTAEFQ